MSVGFTLAMDLLASSIWLFIFSGKRIHLTENNVAMVLMVSMCPQLLSPSVLVQELGELVQHLVTLTNFMFCA